MGQISLRHKPMHCLTDLGETLAGMKIPVLHGPPHGMGHQVNVCFPCKSRYAQAYVSTTTVIMMSCIVRTIR
jgi:hypothetical protein